MEISDRGFKTAFTPLAFAPAPLNDPFANIASAQVTCPLDAQMSLVAWLSCPRSGGFSVGVFGKGLGQVVRAAPGKADGPHAITPQSLCFFVSCFAFFRCFHSIYPHRGILGKSAEASNISSKMQRDNCLIDELRLPYAAKHMLAC